MVRLKYAEDFYIRALLNKVTLGEVMTTPAISIGFESPFRQVVLLFETKRIRHLPITNHENEVVGVISQRDVYRLQPPHKNENGDWVYDLDIMDGFILQNVMVSNPFTLPVQSPLAAAIEPMVRQKYGCIPVVDDQKKLAGIITQYDILKIAFDILQEGQPGPKEGTTS